MFKVFEQVAIIKFLAVSGMNDHQIANTLGMTISGMKSISKLDHIPDELRYYFSKYKMEIQVLFMYLKTNVMYQGELLDSIKEGKVKTFADFKRWYFERFGKEYNPDQKDN